jgi:hypothetical protein
MASRVNPQKLLPAGNTEGTQDAILAVEKQNNAQQTQVYTFLGKQLTSINRNIVAISTNLNTLTAAIQGETVKEQARADQERRTRLVDAERSAFGRSEAVVEGKITSALMRPVRKIQGTVQNKLFDLKKALLFLFGGWLTTKVLKIFRADAEGNTNELEKLKQELITGLAVAGGIFAILSGGVLGLIGTIGSLALTISGWVLKGGFSLIFGRLFPKPPTTQPPKVKPPTTKPPTTRPPTTTTPKPPTTTPKPPATPPRSPSVPPAAPPKSPTTPTQPKPPSGNQQVPPRPGNPRLTNPQPPSAPSAPPKVTKLGAFQRLTELLRGGKSKLANGIKAILRSPGFSSFLGTALKVAYIGGTIKGRLDQGMTPTRAIVPVIPEMLLTLGGAKIGGGLAGLLGLTTGPGALLAALAGAMGGGYLGGLLGSQFTSFLDSNYDSLNLDNFFKGVNDPITKVLQDAGLMKKPETSDGGDSTEEALAALHRQTPSPPGASEAGSPESLSQGAADIKGAPTSPINPVPSGEQKAAQVTQASREGERAIDAQFTEDMNRMKEQFMNPVGKHNAIDDEVPDVLSYNPQNPYAGIAERNFNVKIPGR